LGKDQLQGALDLLILKVLARGSLHGYGIAHRIQEISEEILRVEEGSLYPALHRMEDEGWIAASWGESENNRRAKYYRLTKAGGRLLNTEAKRWTRVSVAISRALEAS
jgi:PadR family transcriptional regulator PadR